MAKPGSAPTEWASDTNFASGPASGSPTKDGLAGAAAQGVIAGLPFEAEPLNALLNETYQWVAWVNDGTAAADADAHIVETDSDGKVSVKKLEIDHSSATGFGLEVTGTATTGSTALGLFTYTGSINDYPAISVVHGGTGGGQLHGVRSQYQGSAATGACFYGNAITSAGGVFVAECSSNSTPAFALAEEPTAAGDFRWWDRSSNSTSTTGGDMWLALSHATPNHDDPLRFYDDNAGAIDYVHSSDVPHLLTSEARDSSDSVLSRTISSYANVVDRQYYARGSDTIRVRAGISLSQTGGGIAEVRLVVDGTEVDVRSLAWPLAATDGEGFDLILCSDVSEAAVSASGLITVALQWRENSASGTIFSARAHIEVYRGFNQD